MQLSDVADQLVTTFSGGMKRRLSLAIASCGYPQVGAMDDGRGGRVQAPFASGCAEEGSSAPAPRPLQLLLIDEPTTGLDALSKRRAHDMIRELKRGRIVVLTSHDMAESEELGDSVAVMAGGRVRAAGEGGRRRMRAREREGRGRIPVGEREREGRGRRPTCPAVSTSSFLPRRRRLAPDA